MCCRAKPHLRNGFEELPVGWAAKMINVYLKTAAYVGDLGRAGLRDVLHPPLDNILMNNLRDRFPEITFNFDGIAAIETYEQYEKIIDGCRMAAKKLECSLFEVEQLFRVEPPETQR